MISFHQDPDSFHVEEKLFYNPRHEGPYVFVRIKKRGISTRTAKLRLSEITGVPMKDIRHAGLKDTASTSIQWLSWEASLQRSELKGTEDLEILDVTRHTNNLSVGHVFKNRFQLRFQVKNHDVFPDEARLGTSFPNFYGPQRFGRAHYTRTSIRESLSRPKPNRRREILSAMQGWLFNDYFIARIGEHGRKPLSDDLWTANNGKNWFQDENDETLSERFAQGEISPTGPVFGYKTKFTVSELTYLDRLGLETQTFRSWGKSAKGSRRVLWVKPKIYGVQNEGGSVSLDFKLTSGSYATVFIVNLFMPHLIGRPIEEWPNFTRPVTLNG
ncbi:MAG: tRNA pseudouridine(13) synthase TruD [Acidobacteriota bacterium]|nr:tRNA pseudouridine(13) synthase TruD [Acidobacteriota bacterium]